jgi:hypothetical protein
MKLFKSFQIPLQVTTLASMLLVGCTNGRSIPPTGSFDSEKAEEILSALEKKLSSPVVMGLRVDLITLQEMVDLRVLDMTHAPADIQNRKSSILGSLDAMSDEILNQLQNSSQNPCERNKVWKEIVQNRKIKTWLWNDGEAVAPGLKGFSSTISGEEACSQSMMTDHLDSENLVNGSRMNPLLRHVVIQGAGPSGLLAALELYANGSAVTVVEKRQSAYSRKQILRLDPKWRASLQYFLANQFQTLIEEKQGRINPNDETFEIATADLETALKNRLVLQMRKNRNSRLKWIQGEITDVDQKQQIYVTVLGQAQAQVISDATHLVLAGGVRNDLRNKVLSTPRKVTPKRPYSIASFEKDSSLKNQRCLESDQFIGTFTSEQADTVVAGVCGNPALAGLPSCSGKREVKALGIREFENGKVLYIGIELPSIIQKLYNECKGDVSCQSTLSETWAIAAKALLTDSETCAPHLFKLENKSHAIFQVYQQQIDVPVKMKGSHSSPLVIAAIGDSLVSPHFFTASGLSGARKSIEDMVHLSRRDSDDYVEDLTRESKETIQFIIEKGKPLFK